MSSNQKNLNSRLLTSDGDNIMYMIEDVLIFFFGAGIALFLAFLISFLSKNEK